MIEFHADDYGLFTAQSERILRCYREGVLNGTSIFANGAELSSCLELLPINGIAISAHLNLMQGHCSASKDLVSLLVDDDGIYSVSFLQLLFCSLTGKRELFKKQIKEEFRAQIQALLPTFHKLNQPLRLDGHAHWHLLPVAFDALMEVIQEDQLCVEYIRIPDEPAHIYLRYFFKIIPFPPINILKSFLLHVLAQRNRRKWGQLLSGMEQKVFLGVLLSGCFDYRRFLVLLPAAEKYSKKLSVGLEILAHPGAVYESDDICKLTNKNDLHFLTSPARNVESESFILLRSIGTFGEN